MKLLVSKIYLRFAYIEIKSPFNLSKMGPSISYNNIYIYIYA